MKKLALANGCVALVDDADYAIARKYHWSVVSRGYAYGWVEKKKVYLHRFLLGLRAGDKREVDHINCNILDNRRSNLRVTDHHGNKWNMRTPRTNRSGAKGVKWYASTKRWRAQIQVKKQYHHLGYFQSLDAATMAYDTAARLYFGEFARPNVGR